MLLFVSNDRRVALSRKKVSEPARVHTGVRLDAAIFERLSKSKLGLSEEIRQRVERTFNEDDLDAVTRELRDGLVNIAALIRADFGTEWHSYPRAYEAFLAAVVQRLENYAPPPPPQISTPGVSGLGSTLGPNDPPETIGRIRENDDRRTKTYPHLTAASQARTRMLAARMARHVRSKGQGERQ
jgi:hypothetical protein